jgi:hypothetical protein
VTEFLWEVPDLALPADVVLLREQAEVVGQAGRSLEQCTRLVEPPVQANAATSQNQQARNSPSLPGNPVVGLGGRVSAR